MSRSDELDKLNAMAKALGPKFTVPPTKLTPEQGRKLYEQIKAKKHPLTDEGVVMDPLEGGGTPVKIKFRPEYDVLIKRIFEARTKEGKRAGGFEYSRILENSKEGKGKVGTGFDHDTLRDMLENPEDYKGRTAKVEAQGEFPSGSLRAPSFKAFHEDKVAFETPPPVDPYLPLNEWLQAIRKTSSGAVEGVKAPGGPPAPVTADALSDLDRADPRSMTALGGTYPSMRQKTAEEPIQIKEVDGEQVRNTYYPEFSMGGNDKAYPQFIPDKTIWVEKGQSPLDKATTLEQEMWERTRMEQKGEKHVKAHNHAAMVEQKIRELITMRKPLKGSRTPMDVDDKREVGRAAPIVAEMAKTASLGISILRRLR